jgi:hypothetical protein
MLKLAIKTGELYDSKTKTFLPESTVVELEHSLASLSKWETIWEKPFLSPEEPSSEETLSYIQCMCIDPDVPPELLWKLDEKNVAEIHAYINKKSTATTIREANQNPNRSVITSEQIYSWMSGFQIPLEAQHWHLNRLIMLIKVCNANNQTDQPPTSPTRDDLAARRAENERRKREWGSRG